MHLFYDDGYSKTIQLKYNELFRSGDKVGGNTAGTILDKPITKWGKTLYGDYIRDGVIHSSAPDGNSLITFKNAATAVTDQFYLVTHFEHQAWVTSQNVSRPPFEPMNLYLNTPGKTTKQGGANPYQYGYPIEITINKKGLTRVHKRYAMGRVSLEQARVLPDERTVYLADDAQDGVRLMFIADRRKDLSSGSLYAAKWIQKESTGGGKADLRWIKLGHTNEKIIHEYLLSKITFSDIFDSKPKRSVGETSDFADEFKPIFVFNGFSPKSDKPEKKSKSAYLKIKPGMEIAAAFLETRRYADLKGATTEFTKMEGQAFNKRDKKFYTVISKAYKGMIAGKNKKRFQDDIKLTGDSDDLKCGVIYESALRKAINDTEGNAIKSEWVAVNMNALITNKFSEGKLCDADGIANPDGLEYSESLRTLFIGEDSDELHASNYLWAYSPESGYLNRILIAPKD